MSLLLDPLMTTERWPELKKFVEEDLLSPLDVFFAERLLKALPQASVSCAALFALLLTLHRQGHLALILDKETLLKSSGKNALPLIEMVLQGALEIPLEMIGPSKPLFQEGNLIYFQKNWRTQSLFLSHLERLEASAPLVSFCSYLETGGLEEVIAHLQVNSILNKEQQAAIANGLTHCVSLITGGPGTGKTYTAAHLVKTCLERLNPEERASFRIILAAPTGKAVHHLEKNLLKFLGETPSIRVGTLHALLSVNPNREVQKAAPLLADLIIVDECSMIDAGLFSLLLSSVLSGTRLVLIGDKNQLPPVEAGSFFADLIDSKCVKTTTLKHSLRTDHTEILELADAIQRGDLDAALAYLNDSQSHIVQRIDLGLKKESTFASALWAYIQPRFPEPSLQEPLAEQVLEANEHFRILCCMRQGPFGVDAINQILLRRYLSSGSGWLTIPIMITRNDYPLNLFNGDTGFLIRSLSSQEESYALFKGKKGEVRKLSPHSLPPFEYAYCLSVHKSQGSEYDEILLLAPEGSEVFGREALYTAITRARKKIIFDGSNEIIEKAIQTSSRKVSGIGKRVQK